ncbi:hypothetical protein KEM56_005024 [Ascosphaera pollenicola]|nr:hypothetical protein KEM56_005024 [Ascosphaera pollenicola]
MSDEGSVPKAHEDGVRFDVDAKGDVVIRCSVLVAHNKRAFYYSRVNSMKMAKTNPFFASFFDPEKLSEGRDVAMKRNQLISKYGSLEAAMRSARYDELPHVTVEMPYLPFRLVRTTLIAWVWRLMHMEHDGYITLDPSWDDAMRGKRLLDWLGGLSILSDRFKCSRNLQWLLDARLDPFVDEEARSASPLYNLRARIDRSLRSPKLKVGDEGRLRQMSGTMSQKIALLVLIEKIGGISQMALKVVLD